MLPRGMAALPRIPRNLQNFIVVPVIDFISNGSLKYVGSLRQRLAKI